MKNKSTIEKLETGVPGFDVLTGGGIPKGRCTLIAGRSGTCKTILAVQTAINLAKRGINALIVAAEEEPADLVHTGDALGLDASKLVQEEKLFVTDLTPPREGPMVVVGEYDAAALIHRIEHYVKAHKIQAIVLDSSTALFGNRPPQDRLRATFFQLVYAFRRLGLTAIVTAEAPDDYGPLTTLGVEDFVADAVIIMRNVVDGERRRRSIEVHKYRRSAHFKGQYPATMTNKGVIVFPLDSEGREKVHHVERYSSGLEGLDQLNHGGWLRDSIVLVRGPSGSGKTTLAGMYARAGAARGERVIYYGFEETKGILMRNFGTLGLQMEEYERAGNLRVMCRYPESTSPEDMLVEIRNSLDEFRPSLVVFDSISSIEHSTSSLGFRQFMVGLSALLREHGRSALLTQTITNLALSEHSVPYLSTIPDVILLLDYRRRGSELERTIRVLKMRGSSHESDERIMEIQPGGLNVKPISRDAAGRPSK
jgi:circadian clock protein KaiC